VIVCVGADYAVPCITSTPIFINKMKKIVLVLLSTVLGICAYGQDADTNTTSDTIRKDALNVFMDASDYIRREIPYINYVRDIKDADVYIISTDQPTGSGGYEFTYFLEGQHAYAGMSDTIAFAIAPDETDDGRRKKEIANLKIGLMRYVARTPLSEYISINFTEPLSETVSTDRWDSWVFSPMVSAFLIGEKSFKTSSIRTGLSMDRFTENWKIIMNLYYRFGKDRFEIEEDIITSDFNSKGFNSLVVKSLSDHWSVGGYLELSASTYRNLDFRAGLRPGIEYDLFPYSESTRRQLRFLYQIGPRYVNYTDTTIYDKMEEFLWLQYLDIAYQVVQKWGTIDVNVGYSNYLHDWSKNSLDFGGEISLRIAKGLSVHIYGNYSIIHDQLGLVKGDVSTEEVLLRRRELETQYLYYTSFGFSYTFGSIYNNVVNPRFGDDW
jgi:hypothetical protein